MSTTTGNVKFSFTYLEGNYYILLNSLKMNIVSILDHIHIHSSERLSSLTNTKQRYCSSRRQHLLLSAECRNGCGKTRKPTVFEHSLLRQFFYRSISQYLNSIGKKTSNHLLCSMFHALWFLLWYLNSFTFSYSQSKFSSVVFKLFN